MNQKYCSQSDLLDYSQLLQRRRIAADGGQQSHVYITIYRLACCVERRRLEFSRRLILNLFCKDNLDALHY